MKKENLFIISMMAIFCSGCSKDFNLQNPDVKSFVNQIKKGTYNCYEKGEDGGDLWLLMPKFTGDHIKTLLDYAKDTVHIYDFPVNPISSRRPFPEGRDYFILGECLLWTVEGIRNGYGFGSLDPFLIDTAKPINERYKGLKGTEILIVRDGYSDWWYNFKNSNWQDTNPLEQTSYRWF